MFKKTLKVSLTVLPILFAIGAAFATNDGYFPSTIKWGKQGGGPCLSGVLQQPVGQCGTINQNFGRCTVILYLTLTIENAFNDSECNFALYKQF